MSTGLANSQPCFKAGSAAPGHARRALLHAIAAEGYTGEQAEIFESSVVFIVIEKIRCRIVGHIKIRPADIVIVAPGRAQAIIMMRIVYSSFFETSSNVPSPLL